MREEFETEGGFPPDQFAGLREVELDAFRFKKVESDEEARSVAGETTPGKIPGRQ